MATTRAGAGPTKLTLRAYQMGFGDCFLLSWHYAGDKKKHVLIDFGTKGMPKSAPKGMLKLVAQDIAAACKEGSPKGNLHAVVLTHRHEDHISGFATAKGGDGPGDMIRMLKPDVVVQPWTEDEKAKPSSKGPGVSQKGRPAFVGMLAHMQDVSLGLALEAARLLSTESDPRRKPELARLQFAGESGIKNLSAVKNLQKMGRRHSFVYHGSKSGLETVLPGVKVTVLGPPTLTQSDSIRKQREEDQAQFWMLHAKAGGQSISGGRRPFPRAGTWSLTTPPTQTRWFIPLVRKMRAEGMRQIVRALDNQMNNTSVILLFEVGGQSFLFPGDAQIENWEYTLGNKALMKRLERVTLYKVGHHGSRNATPKGLWAVFRNRGPAKKEGRLTTVLSTMVGKYPGSEGSEVPRKTLVAALEKDSVLVTTQKLRGKTLSRVSEFPL
jgi:hypothetical protein